MYIYIYDYICMIIYIWLYACICIWSPTPMAHHFSLGGGRDNASPWIILKRLARQLALLPMSIQWESWLISPGWSCKKNCVYSLKASETVCLFKRFDEKYTTKMANLCKFAGQKKHIKHHKTMLLTDFRGIFPPADRRSRASSRRPWQTRPSSLRTLFGRQTRGIPGFFFHKRTENDRMTGKCRWNQMDLHPRIRWENQRFWASLTHPTRSDTFKKNCLNRRRWTWRISGV